MAGCDALLSPTVPIVAPTVASVAPADGRDAAQDAARDAAAAQAAWAIAAGQLADPAIDLVVLDEMTYAFKYGWLELSTVLAAFAARPRQQHVIVTGRAAPTALIDAADTVTEMGMLKHAFQAGVPAMPGLEW